MTSQKFAPSSYSHSFNVDIAKKISIHAAIIYNHLIYWLRINKAKKNNFINGRTWMYETIGQISDFFEYLSERQVMYALKQLVDEKLIIVDNFNKNKFDRTAWYALSDEKILGDSKKVCDTTDFGKCIEPLVSNATDVNCEIKSTDFAPCIIQEEHQKKNQEEHHHHPDDDDDLRLPEEAKKKDRHPTKDDVYLFCTKSKKDWTPEEIDIAWEAFKQADPCVSDVYAYISTIIKNNRTMGQKKASKSKEKQWKNTQSPNSQISTKELETGNTKHSEVVGFSEQDLASLLGQKGIWQKPSLS